MIMIFFLKCEMIEYFFSCYFLLNKEVRDRLIINKDVRNIDMILLKRFFVNIGDNFIFVVFWNREDFFSS